MPGAFEQLRAAVAALPRWKKGVMIGCAMLIAIGLVLLPFEASRSPDLSTSQNPTATTPNGAAGLVDDGTTGAAGADAEEKSELSPAFLRLGFSFFVGFAVGYAFRSFLKLVLVVIGMLLIALFSLSYIEWVTVNWDAMGQSFDVFMASVQQEAGAFRSFITGSLPTAGLASLGLFAGFRRR